MSQVQAHSIEIVPSQNLLMVARLMSLGVQKSTLGLYWDCTPFRVDTEDHTFTTELYRQSMKENARYWQLRWILPQIISSCKSVVTCGWCGSARAPQRPGHEGEPVEAVGPPVAGVVPLVRAVPRALAPAAARHRARVRPGARHGVASSVLEIWTNTRTTESTNM